MLSGARHTRGTIYTSGPSTGRPRRFSPCNLMGPSSQVFPNSSLTSKAGSITVPSSLCGRATATVTRPGSSTASRSSSRTTTSASTALVAKKSKVLRSLHGTNTAALTNNGSWLTSIISQNCNHRLALHIRTTRMCGKVQARKPSGLAKQWGLRRASAPTAMPPLSSQVQCTSTSNSRTVK